MTQAITGNKIPLYRQVVQSLKQGIRRGKFQTGKPLPTVRKLSEEYGVSIRVIQQAICSLREDGTIVTHHGRGMLVANSDSCRKTSLLFGLIQPFHSGSAFGQQVVLYAEEAFSNRENLMVIRSSKGQVAHERKLAEHLLHNGIQGILLWPVENSPNAEYFQQLSEKIPVVVVDRKLNGSHLPFVSLDMYQAGMDICEYFFNTIKKKRLLVILDNLQISPEQKFIHGMQEQARNISQMTNLTVTQFPISSFIRELNHADYSSVETYRAAVRQLIADGKYDGIFCPQEEFLESVIIETGMANEIPNLTLGSMTGPILTRSRAYNEFGVVRWVWDFPEMISQAADLLQRWVLEGKTPIRDTRINIRIL